MDALRCLRGGATVETVVGLDNPLHLLILGVLVLVLFGAKRLPEIGRSLGTGMREFKGSLTGTSQTVPPPTTLSPPPDASGQSTDQSS